MSSDRPKKSTGQTWPWNQIGPKSEEAAAGPKKCASMPQVCCLFSRTSSSRKYWHISNHMSAISVRVAIAYYAISLVFLTPVKHIAIQVANWLSALLQFNQDGSRISYRKMILQQTSWPYFSPRDMALFTTMMAFQGAVSSVTSSVW